jgi:hypothetical protein
MRRGAPAAARLERQRGRDLAPGQATLVGDDAGAVQRATRGSACGMLSPTVVTSAEPALGFARDPDGHALRITQP